MSTKPTDEGAPPETFDEFYRVHFPRLQRFCSGQTRNPALATEAASETLRRLADDWQRVQAMNRPFSYLAKVARHYLLDQYKSESARTKRERGYGLTRILTDRPYDVAGDVADRDLAHRLLQQLDPDEAAAVWLYTNGFYYREIGETLGVSVMKAQTLYKKGVIRLQEVVRDWNRLDGWQDEEGISDEA